MKALPLVPCQEPDGNGVHFLVDWFAFTVKGSSRAFVEKCLVDVLGEEWREWNTVWRGGRRERTKGPFGSLMEVDWGEKWVHVQLKGQGCRAVGVEALLRLHTVMFTHLGAAYVPKRVDVAWDDYRKRVTPKQFRDRFWDTETNSKRPEVVCKARGGHAREDDGPAGGGSYTIGKRVSKRLLRVYDKAAESGGKVDAIRFELECKEEVASDVLWAMSHAAGNRSGAALGFLVGFIDFREGEPGKPVAARLRSPWWEQLVGEAKKAKLSAVERLSLKEWRPVWLRQNSSAFRVLLDLHDGDVLAAAAELMEANPHESARHREWHRALKIARRAKGEGRSLGAGSGAPPQ